MQFLYGLLCLHSGSRLHGQHLSLLCALFFLLSVLCLHISGSHQSNAEREHMQQSAGTQRKSLRLTSQKSPPVEWIMARFKIPLGGENWKWPVHWSQGSAPQLGAKRGADCLLTQRTFPDDLSLGQAWPRPPGVEMCDASCGNNNTTWLIVCIDLEMRLHGRSTATATAMSECLVQPPGNVDNELARGAQTQYLSWPWYS